MDKTIKEELNQEGCENLCAAVVEQAVKDYRKALKILRMNPDNVDAKSTADECELFFTKYAENWTNIDGGKIINAIRARVENEERTKKSRSRRNAGRGN